MRTHRHTLHNRSRTGFTLIELLVVIVIAGVLATIAIPRFAEARSRAVTASAHSDLRNLHIAQDIHFNDHQTFAGDLATLGIVPSSKVTIAVHEHSATGWSATATYPDGQCALYYGSANQIAPATTSTVVACN